MEISVSKLNNSLQSFFLAFMVLLVFPISTFAVSQSQINIELQKKLTHYPQNLLDTKWCNVDAIQQKKWVAAVYNGLGLNALWVDAKGPGNDAKNIFSILKTVAPDGLNPADYGIAQITSMWNSRTAADLAMLDINITIGLLGYIYDMKEGRLAPKLKNPKLFDQAGCSTFNPVTAIQNALESDYISLHVSSLAPEHHYYRTLKQELKHYRNIAAEGGWPMISSGKTLHPGEIDQRVPSIRRLLARIGDLIPRAKFNEQLYDDELVTAVKRFQSRHGLEVDGIVGNNTTASLRVPVKKRIQQILMNMERWRWTEHDLGSKYVVVDIAGFNLQGVKNDFVLLEMPVIVGKLHHETPVFSDTIKYLDFNPYWNITTSIARNEMLAELREDSNYLASKNIRLFSSWQEGAAELDPLNINWDEVSKNQISRFKLRQDPGPWNALGVVKFVFPNKYSIYLHDTPVHGLFEKANRAFSHGCIRLSEPEQLALFLLSDGDGAWTEERIKQVIETEKRKVVRLNTPIPVHLVYQTAWVDKDGLLHFSKDLYGRDQELAKALFGEE